MIENVRPPFQDRVAGPPIQMVFKCLLNGARKWIYTALLSRGFCVVNMGPCLLSQKSCGEINDLLILETNIAPENGWLEDELPFDIADFQVLLLLLFWDCLENQLLLISINFTPKTSHSCLKKWYTRLSRWCQKWKKHTKTVVFWGYRRSLKRVCPGFKSRRWTLVQTVQTIRTLSTPLAGTTTTVQQIFEQSNHGQHEIVGNLCPEQSAEQVVWTKRTQKKKKTTIVPKTS